MDNLRRKIAELKKLVAELLAENAALKTRIAQLEKTSRNSSKPPSSDIVKPKPDGKTSKRKNGAQPGHPQSVRPPFLPEKVDEIIEHELATCSDCGHPLQTTDNRVIFFTAYRKFQKTACIDVQFCWAHLIREILFISEKADKLSSDYGKRLLRYVKSMFETIHRKSHLSGSC